MRPRGRADGQDGPLRSAPSPATARSMPQVGILCHQRTATVSGSWVGWRSHRRDPCASGERRARPADQGGQQVRLSSAHRVNAADRATCSTSAHSRISSRPDPPSPRQRSRRRSSRTHPHRRAPSAPSGSEATSLDAAGADRHRGRQEDRELDVAQENAAWLRLSRTSDADRPCSSTSGTATISERVGRLLGDRPTEPRSRRRGPGRAPAGGVQ